MIILVDRIDSDSEGMAVLQLWCSQMYSSPEPKTPESKTPGLFTMSVQGQLIMLGKYFKKYSDSKNQKTFVVGMLCKNSGDGNIRNSDCEVCIDVAMTPSKMESYLKTQHRKEYTEYHQKEAERKLALTPDISKFAVSGKSATQNYMR